jgi:hypothetical protein
MAESAGRQGELARMTQAERVAGFLDELEALQERWKLQVAAVVGGEGEPGLELLERDSRTRRRLDVRGDVEDRTVIR